MIPNLDAPNAAEELVFRLQHTFDVTPDQKVGVLVVVIFLVMVYAAIASTPAARKK